MKVVIDPQVYNVLDEFYEAWLQVTTTFVIPERPEWLV